jgi:hypothetical protein
MTWDEFAVRCAGTQGARVSTQSQGSWGWGRKEILSLELK